MKRITMKIKFEGQSHQVDANTLVNVLIHYSNLVEMANNEYGQGEKKITLKVNALEKGSFVIDVSPVENVVKSIFSSEGIAYISGLVTIVGGIYELYKWGKGKPITTKEENDKATAFLKDKGTAIVANIVKIYNIKQCREAVSKSIETANQDINVEGISYSFGNEKETVEYKREEFEELIYDGFDSESPIPEERQETVDARLTIIALNFEPGSRWQFMYNGFKIQMVVKDDALMKKIDEGERFGKGDSIHVKMKIIKRYNTMYKAYENKSYKIIEFIEHIEAPRQQNIF